MLVIGAIRVNLVYVLLTQLGHQVWKDLTIGNLFERRLCSGYMLMALHHKTLRWFPSILWGA